MAITKRWHFAIKTLFWAAAGLSLLGAEFVFAAGLPDTVQKIKPSIVAIGTLLKTRSPPVAFFATGFAVEDGLTIVTNAHAIPPVLDGEKKEMLIVLTGQGSNYEQREARVVALDTGHDLAVLKISGEPLPALVIGDSTQMRDGQSLAFTGYPLAMALGLYAATHRATLSAIVPITQPTPTSRQLSATTINRVREGSFSIFQLDGTAYRGNSGSPLYDPETGDVVGIINMVFVKGTKENALTNPSGISYAIPSKHIKQVLERSGKN